jgi:hypothetical protein
MACLFRIVLSRWIIALVALGLVSAPLHAGARVQDATSAHHSAPQEINHGIPGHHHSSPAEGHAAGKACCQTACVMALLTVPCGTVLPVMPAVTVALPPDLMPPATEPPGIDRPPKRS